MLEDIPAAFLAGGGTLSSIGLYCCWAIITGRLIPLRTHKEAVEAASVWRSAAEEASAQVSAMLEVGHTTSALLRSLPAAASDRPESPVKDERQHYRPGSGAGHDGSETP